MPLLAVAALISWTVPFATVISPGSLPVALNETQHTIPYQIPQLPTLFDNYGSFTDTVADGSNPEGPLTSIGGVVTSINGRVATTELWQVALGTAVSGQIAALAMRYRNMTYQYQFYGPVLKCVTVKNVTKLKNTLNNTFQGNLTSANYTSWVAGSGLVSDNPQIRPETLDQYSDESTGAGIYIARGGGSGYDGAPALSSNTNATECRLHNGSYNVAFQFRYPEQNLTVLNLDYGAPIGLSQETLYKNLPREAYAGIMEAFCRLLVGYISGPPDPSTTPWTQQTFFTSVNILHIDWSEAEKTRTGLEQLFQNITLSLLSRSSFIKNSTEADFIPITAFSFVNVYRYDHIGLFLAYGLALLGTLLCAIVGLYAAWANKGSYRNTFSTFVRSTDNDESRSLLDSEDDGRDPLPKQLGPVELVMHRSR
ncbi:hypothetical protein DPSP01_009452 [Paraphaeosphaeria sporulosa]